MTQSEPGPKTGNSFSLPLIIGFLAGLAGLYWFQSSERKPETPPAATEAPATAPQGFSRSLAKGSMAALVIAGTKDDVPPFSFSKADGSPLDLAAFKGKVILVNLWATWCVPCRKEMPALAELQKALSGSDFEVVAISVDRNGAPASQAFLNANNADNLAVYTDRDMKSMAAFEVIGLPASFLIDRSGKERARLAGPAEWNSPDAIAAIKALIAEKG